MISSILEHRFSTEAQAWARAHDDDDDPVVDHRTAVALDFPLFGTVAAWKRALEELTMETAPEDKLRHYGRKLERHAKLLVAVVQLDRLPIADAQQMQGHFHAMLVFIQQIHMVMALRHPDTEFEDRLRTYLYTPTLRRQLARVGHVYWKYYLLVRQRDIEYRQTKVTTGNTTPYDLKMASTGTGGGSSSSTMSSSEGILDKARMGLDRLVDNDIGIAVTPLLPIWLRRTWWMVLSRLWLTTTMNECYRLRHFVATTPLSAYMSLRHVNSERGGGGGEAQITPQEATLLEQRREGWRLLHLLHQHKLFYVEDVSHQEDIGEEDMTSYTLTVHEDSRSENMGAIPRGLHRQRAVTALSMETTWMLLVTLNERWARLRWTPMLEILVVALWYHINEFIFTPHLPSIQAQLNEPRFTQRHENGYLVPTFEFIHLTERILVRHLSLISLQWALLRPHAGRPPAVATAAPIPSAALRAWLLERYTDRDQSAILIRSFRQHAFDQLLLPGDTERQRELEPALNCEPRIVLNALRTTAFAHMADLVLDNDVCRIILDVAAGNEGGPMEDGTRLPVARRLFPWFIVNVLHGVHQMANSMKHSRKTVPALAADDDDDDPFDEELRRSGGSAGPMVAVDDEVLRYLAARDQKDPMDEDDNDNGGGDDDDDDKWRIPIWLHSADLLLPWEFLRQVMPLRKERSFSEEEIQHRNQHSRIVYHVRNEFWCVRWLPETKRWQLDMKKTDIFEALQWVYQLGDTTSIDHWIARFVQ